MIPTTISSAPLAKSIGVDALLTLAKMTSRIGRTVAVWLSWAAGYSRAKADAMVAMLACASA